MAGENKPEKIKLIITGGTFDKKYDAIRGVLDFKDTHLPEILNIVNPNPDIALDLRSLIDSLEMTETHRNEIVKSCGEAEEDLIVITHGTDTMTETAALAGRLQAEGPDSPLAGKTIVFTGAMVPYTISGSDALFNLGTAFSAVQLLPPGVYITMNASVFSWDNVRKNKAEGRFETLV